MDNLQEAYLSVYEQEKGRGPRISDTYDMRDAEGGPKGGATIRGPKRKNVIRINKEEVENWVNSLIEEGYDLSDYTWDEMYEFYLDEAAKNQSNRKLARGMETTTRAREILDTGMTHALPSEKEKMMSRLTSRQNDIKQVQRRRSTEGLGEATKAETHRERVDPSFSRRIARNDRYREENPKAGINAQLFRQREHAKRRVKKEEFDLFDYILEYLIAEGYADTNENAIAIMASMSEDWREEILDEANRGEAHFNTPNWDKVWDRTQRDYAGPRGTSHQSTHRDRRPNGKMETGNQTTKRLSKERRQSHKDTRGVKQIKGGKGVKMQFGR